MPGKRNIVNGKRLRIGIYAGTFDPVHVGHIAFALQAMEQAKLDKVYFLPERQPRHKQGVEHFGHRVAMLERAARPHQRFGVIELPDISFTIARSLPRLQKLFAGDQLVFLFGSDVAKDIAYWAQAKHLLGRHELVIGLRAATEQTKLEQTIASWTVQPPAVTIFNSYAPSVSSRTIRDALRQRQRVQGLLESVIRYSNRHWLYVSVT